MSFWRLWQPSTPPPTLPTSQEGRVGASSIVQASKHQRRVGAAKPKRVRQYHIDFAFARPVWHQIDCSLDGWMVEVECWRRNPVAHRQNRENGLHGTGGPEQMTDRRFGVRHGDAAGVVADEPLHRVEFDLVAEWRRCAVRID